MDDDLNVSGALAVVHDTVRAGNTALDDGDDDAAHEAAAAVVAMTEVLGVNPLSPIWDNARPRRRGRRARPLSTHWSPTSSLLASPPARQGISRRPTRSATG